VANYLDTSTGTRAVELLSGPFGTPLAADGLLQPPRGGQDVDIAVGSSGNLYDATLYLQSVNNGVGSYGIGAGACPAGSIPTQMSSCYGQQRVDNSHTDRPWIAAYGPSTVYLSYHDGSQSGQIDVAKSTDAGHTWPTVAEAINPSLRHQANFNNMLGNIVVDPSSGTVYQPFVAGTPTHKGGQVNYTAMYMAISHDGGQTFVDTPVYQAPAGARLNNFFPTATVDAGGNVYLGWSDGHDVWLTSSSTQGATWTASVKISQDSASLQTSVEPWIYGGAAGNVAVVWYGSAATDNMAAAATWNVYFAQVRQATTSAPSIGQTVASDHGILSGPLCTQGDACPAGTRTLFDDFQVALDPRTGLAAIAYGDASDATNPYQIAVAQQTGGPGL